MGRTILGRRAFLRNAVGAGGVLLGGGLVRVRADEPETAGGLIVRQSEPDNLEMPFTTVDHFLTPTERFYVRNHFAVPKVDLAGWRLRVTGAVRQPLDLTYDDLLALPSRTAAVTLECAGNGRSFLQSKVKGVQWALGAVGTAEWIGVTLATVLEKAGVRPEAVDVVLEGADRGEPSNEPKPPGTLSFAHGLPLAKARKPEVLLAFKMNGSPLTPRHGFPVRAVVGGWYGMAAVKWLNRIVITERPFRGYEETIDYAVWDRRDGVPNLTPVTDIQVKASIARPTADEVVPAGKDYRVHGAAWAGEADVTKVDVSTDGGTTFAPAQLLGNSVPFSWRLWEYHWKSPAVGKHVLQVRTTDSQNRSQPTRRDPDRRGYVINHVVPTPVDVRG